MTSIKTILQTSFILFLCLGNTVHAVNEEDLLTADQAFQLSLTRETPTTFKAHWNIAEGYYLYKKRIKAKLATTSQFLINDIQFPQGIQLNDDNFGDVEVFRNSLTVLIRLTDNQQSAISNDQKNSAEDILTLKYQGCADVGVCYSPIKVQRNIHQNNHTNTASKKETVVSEQDAIAGSLASDNILLTLISFFGFGLLLAFTPCVFPMIPILSSIIIGQGKELSTKRAFSLSLAYVLAMALSYTFVGILAALFGTNLQIWFQTPWVLISFSLVFVVLSLSMFGFYELQMPASIQLKLNAISNKQQGGKLASAAIMGMLSALVVGPCVTAPLIGALIYIGQTGDAVMGGSALFALGLGMGAPLLVLGTSAAKFMPKSGIWMEKVKYAFGVSMLAVAIWLLSRIISPIFTQLLWAVLLISCAIYMGALMSHTDTTKPWSLFWKSLGFTSLVWGMLMVIGAASGKSDLISPLKPLIAQSNSSSILNQTVLNNSHTGINFKSIRGENEFSHELNKAANNHDVLMLDLYADWCASCKEMEALTFVDPNVIALTNRIGTIQADVTDNSAQDQALLKKYNLIGPPAILFFDRSGSEIRNLRLVGYTEADTLALHLEKAIASQ